MFNKKIKSESKLHLKNKKKQDVTFKDNNDIYKLFEDTCNQLKGDELNTYLLETADVITDNKMTYEEKKEIIGPKDPTKVVRIETKDSDPVYLNPRDAFVYKKFHYERINHFKDKIKSLQGKENKTIPPEVFTLLEAELIKKKKTFQDLDYQLTRKLLKLTNQSRYYRNIYLILSIVKKDFIIIPEQIEEKLYKMFEQIQEPYEKYKGTKKKSFFSYDYIIYKFFEILNLDDFTHYCKLLDNNDKITEHDRIWKKICQDLNYPFYITFK